MNDPIVYSVGTKVYRYIENEKGELKPTVLRITKYDEETNKYKAIVIDGEDREYGNPTGWFDYDIIHNKYVKLNADGIVSFNIARDGEVQDVIIMIHPSSENNEFGFVPFAVCRQDCIDFFRMSTTPTPVKGQVWAGTSISKKTCPAEMNITQFIDVDDFTYSKFVAVYLDDTIDDMLKLIHVDKFDKILQAYKKKHYGDNLVGLCDTVAQLMEETGFMYDFHEAMGVTEVPFLIQQTPEVIELLKQVIGEMTTKFITNIYIIPFSKEVNMSEFQRPYILATPDHTKAKSEDQNIFIIGYDIDPDRDYMTMKYGTNNKDDIIAKMGFRTL